MKKLIPVPFLIPFFLSSLLLLISTNCTNSTNSTNTATNIRLPLFFGDNMVLQQKTAVPIWGKADPGGTLTVQIAGRRKSAAVSDSGTWRVTLKTPKAGGPFVLKIIGQDTLTFKNVMFGEVWFASGQSNMQMPVGKGGEVLNYKAEIAAANYPDIRLFQTKQTISRTPLEDVQGAGWQPCSPETVPEFSALAYFFGRMLYQKLHVPIGLIHSSWGGTPAEAWMSEKALKAFPEFAKAVQDVKESFDIVNYESHVQRYKKDIAAWEKTVGRILDNSATLKLGWQKRGFNDCGWKTMDLPAIWETRGLDVDGVVWFRRSVNIPASWRGQDVTLSLGPVNDFDVTWFNGRKVGSTSFYNVPRVYKIPASLVKRGKNSIVVEVLDVGNRGGFEGRKKQMGLTSASGDSISLAGRWHFKRDAYYPNMGRIPTIPAAPLFENLPTTLFNSMVSPFIPFSIRGVIWYQGANNIPHAEQYQRLFPALIRDWRSRWGEGNFPFIYGQLANFMAATPQPGESDWAELREAQFMALKEPNTGMAVAIDIGEENNLHPKNKQELARRFALHALKMAYNMDVENSGPLYKSMKIEGNKIRLFFNHVDGGLIFKKNSVPKFPGAGNGFAIAGADHKFVRADAVIDGETILVSSPQVAQPVAVRYAWARNPVCNLVNKAGLPASPFRTDSWPGLTAGKK